MDSHQKAGAVLQARNILSLVKAPDSRIKSVNVEHQVFNAAGLKLDCLTCLIGDSNCEALADRIAFFCCRCHHADGSVVRILATQKNEIQRKENEDWSHVGTLPSKPTLELVHLFYQ
jgi:hypothetical protein